MKKIISIALIALLFCTAAFAQSPNQPTGDSYLAMSKQDRLKAVTSLIDDAKKGGVTIKETPVSYCIRLDKFYVKHPDLKSKPLAVVLKTLIIMQYDWTEKGVDKDQLARQWLGEQLYEKNKARLSKTSKK